MTDGVSTSLSGENCYGHESKGKKHFIAVPKEGGGYELYRLKDWLRDHPEHDPSGGDPGEMTSHQLREALKKNGWSVEEVVVCFKPPA